MKKELIKNKLDLYLEFNSDELFKNTDLAVIFGGAIRDIVSNSDINDIKDIDIMGLPISLLNMSRVLERNDYIQVDLIKPDIYSVYKDIKCIFQPTTYINKNGKIVQLIRPSQINYKERNFDNYKLAFFNLLSNVDLTSSGLFYDGKELYESMHSSYLHCKLKIYEIISTSMMYNQERTMLRFRNLNIKGWKNINKVDKKLLSRTLKILKIKDIKIKNISDYISMNNNILPVKNRKY